MFRQIAVLFQTDTAQALELFGKIEFENFVLELDKTTEPALSKFVQVVCKPLLVAARMYPWRGNLHKQGLVADKLALADRLAPVEWLPNKQVAEQLTHIVRTVMIAFE